MSVTETHGGSAVATPPVLQPDAFFELLRGAATGGGRVVALFGTGAAPGTELVAVVATDPLGLLRIARTRFATSSRLTGRLAIWKRSRVTANMASSCGSST